MQFVKGLPQGIFVGQTQIHHAKAHVAPMQNLAGFNLALHVHDDPVRVQQHRMILLEELSRFGASRCTWLNQTHSILCHNLDQHMPLNALEGDALITQNRGHVLMMMTADCLPIALGNAQGTEIANLHAGWRGLAQGIIEVTISKMQFQPSWAWLGAAISQPCFEVGEEVKTIFCEKYPALEIAFQQGEKPEKFYADLYAIATYILQKNGVKVILGADQCSYSQSEQYYSYRRDAKTGRMASFVFIG